jgi:small subunit ribosomal protein S17
MADEELDTAPEAEVSEETAAEGTASEETSAEAAESSEKKTTEKPAPPITEVPRKQRLAEERAAKKAAAGPNPSLTPEQRQEQRDLLRQQKAAARTHQRGKERAAYKASEHERVPTPPREHEVGNKKVRQGIVVSDKADKTITVRIDVQRPHRKYRKIVRTSTTFHAHDERNDAHIGDTVVIQESRPLSATKRWRLVEVVERAR